MRSKPIPKTVQEFMIENNMEVNPDVFSWLVKYQKFLNHKNYELYLKKNPKEEKLIFKKFKL